jgi:enediyne biosynthesis protein E4
MSHGELMPAWTAVLLVLALLFDGCDGGPGSQRGDGGAPAHDADAEVDAGALADAGARDPSDAGGQDGAQPAPPPVEFSFSEVAAEVGLAYVQAPRATEIGCEDFSERKCPFTSVHMSGGAATGDFDADGRLDLYVTRLDAPGILYRNLGAGRFEDVTEPLGLAGAAAGGNGAGFADIDNDGDLDLYVTNLLTSRFHLYVNHGDRFVEEGVERGAAIVTGDRHYGFSVSFGDYDRDGYLDLHTTEWVQLPDDTTAENHARLLRNLGPEAPGTFEDATDGAGVNLLEGPRGTRASFASSFSDLDGDGWPELVVVADFNASRLFWNAGDGTFIDGTAFSRVGTDLNGMGCALGDYDGDGDIDWFVTAIHDPDYRCDNVSCGWGTTGNRLYENQGDRGFTDVTDAAGVRDGGWGWGTAFFDPDNDGDLDLIMTNGVDFPNDEAALFRSDATRLFLNDGARGFTDVASVSGVDDRGDGRGLLVFDYDDDGDEDVLIVQHEGRPKLYRNDAGNIRPWLRVRLRGSASNPDGIGSRVSLRRRAGEAPLVREIRAGSQFLGQSETIAHFGLGTFEGPLLELRVDWPSGHRSVLNDLTARTTVVVDE